MTTAISLNLVLPRTCDEEELPPVSTTFFRDELPAGAGGCDEDLWPADPEAITIWEQRSGRRRLVKSIGYGCMAALLACASLIGIHGSSRESMLAWGTLGSVPARPAAAAPAYVAPAAPAATEAHEAEVAPATVTVIPAMVIEASPARRAQAPALAARPRPAPARSIWADPYADLAPAKAKPAAPKAKQAVSSLDDPY